LGAAGHWLSGGTPSKARPDYWEGDVPWVSPKDMKRFRLDDVEDHISAAAVIDGTRVVPPGSVFIVVRGMILAHTFPVCIANRAMAFNQDVKAIVPNGTVDGGFLAHWLDGRSDGLLRLVTESTHGTKRIELRDLQAFPLLLPTTAEQRQIAAILDTVDNAISKTAQIIAKLKLVKQGLLHDLLTRGVDENGELRNPTKHPEHFKDSPLGRIPREWAATSLRDACTLIKDGTHLPPKRVEDGPFLLSVRNMINGALVLRGDDTHVSWSFYRQMHCNWGIEEGDVLLAIVGATLGKCARVGPLPPFTLQRSVAVLRGDRTVMDSEFLGLVAQSAPFQARLWQAVNQTAQPGLYLDQLGSMLVALPSRAEQDVLCAKFGGIDLRMADERREHGKLQLVKEGLTEDLLTGRVRIAQLLEDAAE
jgi:restriction endonuclease S subunit